MAYQVQYSRSDSVNLDEPVLFWLKKRTRFITDKDNLTWVIQDPIISHLIPTFFVLDKKGSLHLSDEMRDLARKAYLKNKLLSVWREAQLNSILNVFDAAGIQVIPLKGVILQSTLYEDPAVRPMSDVDLLVRPKDFLQSIELLSHHGMQLQLKGIYKEGIEQLVEMPRDWRPNAVSFTNEKGLSLDLHQSFLNPWFKPAYLLNMGLVWERSSPLAAATGNLWDVGLSPYDMLAHLCLHLALHGLQSMHSYLDIDLWLRGLPDDWDWDLFLNVVEEWQIRSATYHVFLFCRAFMNTPIPDNILKKLDPGRFARWRVRVLITSESLLEDRSSLGRRYPTLVKMVVVDRMSSIAKTLYHLIFPNKKRRAYLPSQQSLLRHWIHIFKVLERGD